MALLEFAQFGAVIFIAAVLAFVVKRFLDFLSKKDEEFISVITNHFNEDLKSRENLGDKLEGMGDKIEKNTFVTDQLLKWLERRNGK